MLKEITDQAAQGMVLMGTPWAPAPQMLPFESHTEDGVIVHAVLSGGTLLVSKALEEKLTSGCQPIKQVKP